MPVGKVTTTPSPAIMPQLPQTQPPHGPADQGVARLTPQLPQTQSLHGPAGQGATRLNRECADSADLMEAITKGYKELADKVAENNDKYEHFLQQDENQPKVLGSKALFGLVSPVASGAERLLHLREGSLTGNKLASKTQLVRSLRAQVEALHGLKAALEELNNRIGAVADKKALTPQQQQTLRQQVAEAEQQLSAFQRTIDLTAADEAPGQMFEPVEALNRMANNMQRSLREYQISITEGNCLPDLSAIAENVPVGGNMEQRAGAHVQSHLPPNPTTGMKPSFPGFRPVESHLPPEPATDLKHSFPDFRPVENHLSPNLATETTQAIEQAMQPVSGRKFLEELATLHRSSRDLCDKVPDTPRSPDTESQYQELLHARRGLMFSKYKDTEDGQLLRFVHLCAVDMDKGRAREIATALEDNRDLREWAMEGRKLLLEINKAQEHYNTAGELFPEQPDLEELQEAELFAEQSELEELQERIRRYVDSSHSPLDSS